MQLDVSGWYTNIILTDDEMKQLCTPGMGADTCVWLLLGPTGFECSCLNKPHSLVDKWRNGKTVAKRDGCDFVKGINPVELDAEKHTIEVPIGEDE